MKNKISLILLLFFIGMTSLCFANVYDGSYFSLGLVSEIIGRPKYDLVFDANKVANVEKYNYAEAKSRHPVTLNASFGYGSAVVSDKYYIGGEVGVFLPGNNYKITTNQQSGVDRLWRPSVAANANFGVITSKNLLFYALTGVAAAKVSCDLNFAASNVYNSDLMHLANIKYTRWRYSPIVGLGFSTPLLRNLFANIEYRYIPWGSLVNDDINETKIWFINPVGNSSLRISTQQTVAIKINYRF